MGLFDVELKYTWRVSRAAWYVRLYRWVWDAREEDITFCKIFWAYVFMWVGLPLKCLLIAVNRVGGLIAGGARLVAQVVAGVRRRLSQVREHEARLTPQRIEVPLTAPRPIEPAWMKKGEKSEIGMFLAKVFVQRLASAQSIPVMRRLLTVVEDTTTAASMRTQTVSWAGRRALHTTGRGMARTGEGILTVGAYALGALLVVSMCTGRTLAMLAGRTGYRLAPIAAFSFDAVCAGLWALLWPVRRFAGLIDRTLSAVGKVLAVGIAVTIVVAYAAVVVLVLAGAALHPVLLLLGLGLLIATLAVGLGFGWFCAFAVERWIAPPLYHEVIYPTWTVARNGVEQGTRGIGEGTVGFGKIMLLGYKAVKSNTCPKIEVED